MSEQVKERQFNLSAWKCKECDSPLMGTKSGSVCPNGHGYLLPRMPPAIRRINHAVLMNMQRITNRWGRFYLEDGREVIVERLVSREIKEDELHKHALDGHRIVRIREKKHE